MILFEIILAALLLSLATGGSLRQLQAEHLTGEWVLFVVLPVQLLWPSIAVRLGIGCALSIVIWLVLMAALAAVLFLNAQKRWMLAVAGLGIAMNILVIGVNTGMPVSLKATGELGRSYEETLVRLDETCLHRPLDQDTQLAFLADVIAVPGPTWQAGVLSAGDLLLAFGLGAWVFTAARRDALVVKRIQ